MTKVQTPLVAMGEPVEHAEREANAVRTELSPPPPRKHRTYTMEQIKAANRDAGMCWFSAEAMRFFGSRVHTTTYGPDSTGRVFFVSSERTGFDWDAPRAFTVRVFDPSTGAVDTDGAFLAHGTRSAAHAAARNAAREG